jgi:hypothetical protein
VADLAAYTARINAMNFALANDDGTGARDYAGADVVLIGVSRSERRRLACTWRFRVRGFGRQLSIGAGRFGGRWAAGSVVAASP